MEWLETDVAVVGAGIAGLTAASELLAAGRDVVVLAARERVGGRVLNVDLGRHPNELGGQWIARTRRPCTRSAESSGSSSSTRTGTATTSTSAGPDLARPIGPIHWACTDIAGVGNMHMEGAIRSGRRAAADILSI